MKSLSEKKKVYLLLLETIFTFLTLVVAAFFVNKVEPDFLQKNVVYQTISFLFISFIYINIATVNREFKIAAIVKILKTICNLIVALVLPNFMPIMISTYFLSDILEFIVSLLEIPFAYFFCKGFSKLITKNTNNMLLANKWEKLLVANVVLAIINLIIYINGLYADTTIFFGNAALALLFSFISLVFMVVVGILEIIYIIKTAKEI